MHLPRSAHRALVVGLATASLSIAPADAPARGSVVVFEASTRSTIQVTLGSAISQPESVPVTGSLEIEGPVSGAGPVTIRNIQMVIPGMTFLMNGTVQLGSVQLASAPGASVTLNAAAGPSQESLFSGAGPACLLAGTVEYMVGGTMCNSVLARGGVCSGVCPLGDIGPRSSAIFNGSILPSPGPRAVRLLLSVGTPFRPGGEAWSWVAYDIVVHGTLSGQTTCAADFQAPAGVDVGDLFGFLNAWFSGDPAADINGGGLTVQDIFDFLNAWFAGCP